VIHEVPLERRTLHGHFSRDLPPVLTIDSGDTLRFATLDAGWHAVPERRHFDELDPELDGGHALVGPVEIRGARHPCVWRVYASASACMSSCRTDNITK